MTVLQIACDGTIRGEPAILGSEPALFILSNSGFDCS